MGANPLNNWAEVNKCAIAKDEWYYSWWRPAHTTK